MLLARIKTQLSLKRTAEKLRAAELSTTSIDHNRKDIERTLDQIAHHRVHEELLGDLENPEEFRYHVLYDNTPMTVRFSGRAKRPSRSARASTA